MPGQLHLFKGRRQRGAKAPGPKEFALHCMVADTLRRWADPAWVWWHTPNGERRDPVTGARLKRLGVVPGIPDFVFVGPGRAIVFLELKRAGGRLSDEQSAIAHKLVRNGCTWHCTDDYADALGMLRDFGIIQNNIQVQ